MVKSTEHGIQILGIERWFKSGSTVVQNGFNRAKSGNPGDVVFMDVNGVFECGNIGSNNSLGWALSGFSGVITNGGARDTDEIIEAGKIPVYCRNGYSTRGIRPGRLIIESYNLPISCAGVLVYPGDLVVADGDGVIIVPRDHALEVGRLAHEIMTGDQAGRAQKLKIKNILVAF